MATNNTENTTTTAAATTTENNDKSLLSKAKDTLVNLKDQVKDLLTDNNNNDDEIKGMPKAKFEKTKAELESSLHFKQQEEENDQGMSKEKFDETKAELESSLHFKQPEELANDGVHVQNQNQTGVEFQNQNGTNMNMDYKEVNQQEFVKAPASLLQQTEIVDDKRDEKKFSKLDQNETHVLPTLHVKEKPVIIEKEIEFEKPVEIKQTIIHKEKPVIIEKPIIVEKNEHYREATEFKQNNEKIVKESISEQDVGNKDQEILLNLRQDRINTFNDTTPIVQHEKQHVKLDTDIREQQPQIHEKEVVYQQPVEIERTKIEKIKPKVHEDVTLKKEHIYEKTAPEVYQDTPKVLEKEKYFSQDTTDAATAGTAATVDISRDNDVSTFNAANIAKEENNNQKEIM